jgi:sugar-specific transcriptional regulator TrmB
MQKKSLYEKLTKFGLNSYEAKSYISLLDRNNLTASEISRITGIPRARVYETMENLMVKGLCNLIPGKFKKYGATNPSILKEELMNSELRKLKIKRENLNNEITKIDKEFSSLQDITDDFISELNPLFERNQGRGDPLDYIEVIKDPYQISKKFMQLLSAAKEEVLSFVKPPYTRSRPKLKEQIDVGEEILKSGTRFKVIYEIPTDEEEKRWLFELIQSSVRAGEEARVIKELPIKLAIFDSKIVLYTLEDPVSHKISLTTQIVEHRALAKCLMMLFNYLWEQGLDYHVLEE